MRVTTASATVTADASADPRLVEVFEAYQVFCELGWHYAAWTNLFLSLNGYLVNFFSCEDGKLPITHMSMRIRYLANLTIEQFGDVTSDTVYALLYQAGFGSLKEFDTPPRNLLSSIGATDLHSLLLDLTKELGERASLSATRSRGIWLSSLPSDWNPAQGSDWRIAHTLVNLLSVQEDEIFHKAAPTTTNSDAIVKVPSVARRLLRRALSARIGSTQPSNRFQPAQREDSSPPALSFPKFSWKFRVDSVQTRDSNLGVGRKLQTSLVLPQAHQQLAKGDDPSLRRTSEKEEIALVRSEDGHLRRVKSDESHRSSRTLALSVDLEGQSSLRSKKSIGSLSQRSSIDIGELSRIGDMNHVSIVNIARDKRLSMLSVTRVSIKSDTTNITRHSFVTAGSHFSYDRRKTRRSSLGSFHTVATPPSLDDGSNPEGLYHSLLQLRDLVPLPMLETDWSGRGQHVEYETTEQDQIPLQVEKVLGQTRNALVESVKCRRVRIVRKTIRCTKWNGLKLEAILSEVQHLDRVQHAHIVRLVGTYVMGSDLAILTYPCAQWNLEQFMQEAPSSTDAQVRAKSLRQFFTCLAKVLDFMHSFPLKHMDIKPANLLVRDIETSELKSNSPYKIYVTDFGTARTYSSVDESDTETPTSFTRTYAAREVVLQESRGLSADIFSLGCVYAEMLAVTLDASIGKLESSFREGLALARGQNDGGLRAYHLRTQEVRSWLTQLDIQEPELDVIREWIYNMIDPDPTQRPNASHIAHDPQLPFPCSSCTLRTGPEDFEVAEPLLEQTPHP